MPIHIALNDLAAVFLKTGFLTMSINNTQYEYINPIQGGPFGRFKSEEGSIYEVHFGLPKSF